MTSFGRHLRAWVALAAFIGSFGIPFVNAGHLMLDDDAACGSAAAWDGRSTTRFEAGTPTAPGTHCPFCHWQRAVGGASIASVDSTAPWLEPAEVRAAARARFVAASVFPHRPSRAPPSSLVS